MSSSTAATTTTGAEPIVDLALTFVRKSMGEQLSELASYADSHTNAPVSIPSFPAPQVLSEDAPPPVWPAWDALIPACTHPTSLVGGPPDCYGSGAHLSHFESHVANIFGKEQALFFATGTMAQLVALRIHSQGRNKILACHPKCHLMLHEANAFDVLLGFSSCLIGSPHRPMTADEVDAAFSKHWKQPCVLILELPEREIGGQVIAWEDLLRIRELCTARGIHMHLDGARIWEIQPFFRKSFQEIASIFDSIYVSFYKGLASTAAGAMLLGSSAFITEARQWQHRMGGRLWQGYSLSLAAEKALNENVNSFAARANKMREVVAALTAAQAQFVASKNNDAPRVLVRTVPKIKSEPAAAATATSLDAGDESAASSTSAASSSSSSSSSTAAPVTVTSTDDDAAPFEPFFHFVPAVPTCSLVHMYLGMSQEVAEGLRDAVRDDDDPTERTSLFSRIRASSKKQCYWEWNMGTENLRIPTERFVRAWNNFMQRRYEQLKAQVQAQ